jgi:hypothetical protein
MSTVEYITGLWIPHVGGVLHQLTLAKDDWWVYTIVPVMVCLIGVNLFFRHFVAITWFSVKLLISVIVYANIRDIFTETIGNNPLHIDSNLLGLAAGTFEFSRSLGMQIVKSRAFTALEAACPICFPHTTDKHNPPRYEPPIPEPPIPVPPPQENSTLFGLATISRYIPLEMFKSVCPSCFTDTQSEDATFYHKPFHIWEYVGWG